MTANEVGRGTYCKMESGMCMGFLGKDHDVCVFLSSHLFVGGTPGGTPFLRISRQEDRHLVSTWTSGSQERDTHMQQTSRFLRELLQMCAPPPFQKKKQKNIYVLQLYSIYYTHCLVYPPSVSPIPPPVHLLSAACAAPSHGYKPMRASTLWFYYVLFLWGIFFPPHGKMVSHWGISLSIVSVLETVHTPLM